MLVFYDAYNAQRPAQSARAALVSLRGRCRMRCSGLPLRLQADLLFCRHHRHAAKSLEPAPSQPAGRPEFARTAYWEDLPAARTIEYFRTLGALTERRRILADSDSPGPYEPYEPARRNRRPTSSSIRRPPGTVEFSGHALPSWQLHFARKFAALAPSTACKMVLLHVPAVDEMTAPVIRERQFWPEALAGRHRPWSGFLPPNYSPA